MDSFGFSSPVSKREAVISIYWNAPKRLSQRAWTALSDLHEMWMDLDTCAPREALT